MTDLIPYGIQEELSDVRAHVCVVIQRVYVYPTQAVRDLLNRIHFPKGKAFQNGQLTAEGYLVPPAKIPRIRQFELPDHYWHSCPIRQEMSTSEKGRLAVRLVRMGLDDLRITLPIQPRVIDDLDLQIEGVDIIATLDARIQVKCDFDGGPKSLGGSGNLFIQTAEANPYSRH